MPLPEKIQVEIVTPERRVVSVEADEVVLPGALGSFGVLPGHHPMLAALGPGVAQVKVKGQVETFALGGGYADVGPERVSVLAESCERGTEIDKARAERKLAELRERLGGLLGEGDAEALEGQMLKQMARLDALGR